VVTTKGDDSRKGLAILCWTFLFGIGRWGSGQDCIVAFFDLVKRPGVVVSVRPTISFVGCERWKQTHEVTGISPQSRTVAQLLKGFVSSGTLYPPLKPTLREPMRTKKGISVYAVGGTD